jgi:hypothetical protein
VTDAATIGPDAAFEFSSLGQGPYMLFVTAGGFVPRFTGFQLSNDTTVDFRLVAKGAMASLAGFVSKRPASPVMSHVEPVEACTVTARFRSALECRETWLLQAFPEFQARCRTYTAVTDENGEFFIDSIMLSANGDSITVEAKKRGFATAAVKAELNNRETSTADFLLDGLYDNRDSAVINGVRFYLASNKFLYGRGDSLRVRYTVDNQSDRKVTFENGGLSAPCTYFMEITGDRGDTLFASYAGQACPRMLVTWSLGPGEKDSIDFAPFFIDGDNEFMQITAGMFDDDGTRVNIEVAVGGETGLRRTGGSAAAAADAAFLTRCGPGIFTLNLARPQRVSAAVYLPNGVELSRLFDNTHMSKGSHVLWYNAGRAGSAIGILRVQGEHFTVIRKIGFVK